MATTFSAPPVNHRFELVVPEQVASTDAQLHPTSNVLKVWTVSLLVFGVTLLGSISLWLWYGLQHYQDCL